MEVGGGRCRQIDGFFTRERWIFVVVVYLLVELWWHRWGFSPHTHCFSFKLKMQTHIVVESIVAVKSRKHQHFVSGGRAAGNVGYREIPINAWKQLKARLHFETQGYSDSSWCCSPYLEPSKPCLDGASEGAQTGKVTVWPRALIPKNTCLKNIRKQWRSENQVQMCSCAKKT